MEKALNSSKAEKILESWDGVSLPPIDESAKFLRNDIQKLYEESKAIVAGLDSNKKDYLIDVNFGVRLKAYLDEQDWFNLRVGANIDFWRFLSVIVIPHIVAERYDAKAISRYWSKPSRIWLRAIWWYAYLSWQDDEESTIKLLSSDLFTTDSIVGLVERTGHYGSRIKLYNTIMTAVGSIQKDDVDTFSKTKKGSNDTLFRAIMRKNTSRAFLQEPELCEGGVRGYVTSLFKDLGIDLILPNEKQEAESRDSISPKQEIIISSDFEDSEPPKVTKRKRQRILRNASQKGISFKDADRYQKLSERLHLVKSDIVVLRVDAIVNSTNRDLAAGSGISAHIHAAAGEALAVACWRFPVCTPGHCIKTEGYNLPTSHILHTVVPECRGIDSVNSPNTALSSCYKNIMKVAKESKFSSVAIPCLGTGYGNYPKHEAAKIALQTLQSALDTNEYGTDFVVCCFDDNDYDIYLEAWKEYCATQYPQSIANIEQNNEYKHEEQTAINVVAPTSCAEIEYSKDGTKLLKAKSIQGHFDVPQNVYWIESKAFENCTELKSITIPHSVNYIGEAAFAGCKKLEYIELPNSIRILNEKLFAHCEKLKSVVLQENLKVIRERVFYECPNLKSITIPQTVTEISEYAFTRSSIISIHCRLLLEHLGIAKISPNAFKQMLTKYALFIPRGLEKEYKKRNLFRNYTIIREE